MGMGKELWQEMRRGKGSEQIQTTAIFHRSPFTINLYTLSYPHQVEAKYEKSAKNK